MFALFSQMLSFAVLTSLLLLWPAALAGEQERAAPEPGAGGARVQIVPRLGRPGAEAEPVSRADLRVDVPLVLIPVSVTTPLGATVTGLNRFHFRVFEEGVEQRISHFFIEDAPISVGLLFDVSGSMRRKIDKSCEAAGRFFQTANPGDEFFLIQFSDKPRLVVSFTTDSGEIEDRMSRANAFGRTALFDALRLALLQMKRARHSRKAILILSDGGDNRSRYTESETRDALREVDVQVFALGIFEQKARSLTREERQGPQVLAELAGETGGRLYAVGDLHELPDYCARIGAELRNRYVLGYAPSNRSNDGKYRRVRVTLQQAEGFPSATAHFRPGYYAPLR